MDVRVATDADVPALHRLVERAYRGDVAKQGWTHEADLLDGQRTDAPMLAAMIADAEGTVLLAEVAGQLVGSVHIQRIREGCAYLGMLSVDPERQDGGIGRQLIDAGEQLAIDHFGCTHMEMSVIAQRSELIDYYVRRGYAETGETRPFPYEDQRLGTARSRDLEFIIMAKTLRSPMP